MPGRLELPTRTFLDSDAGTVDSPHRAFFVTSGYEPRKEDNKQGVQPLAKPLLFEKVVCFADRGSGGYTKRLQVPASSPTITAIDDEGGKCNRLQQF